MSACATIAAVMLACGSRLAAIGMVGADDGADAAEQFAFGVVEALRHHGAVQFEEDAVEGTCLHRVGQGGDQEGGDALEGFGGDRAGGVGEAPEERRDLRPGLLRRGDGAGAGHRGRAQGLDQGVGALQRREAAGAEEVLPARRHRREGVALVLEAADGDAHRAQSRTRPAVARAVSASTRRPAVAHSGVMLSASLWLMPPWQGVKSMTEGTRRAR